MFVGKYTIYAAGLSLNGTQTWSTQLINFLDDHPMKEGLIFDWNGILEQVDTSFMQLEGV